MNIILKVENLKKKFKDFTLKDISFSLERGYIMGFIGPNGAGKTTTIKLIMNLIKKDGGKVIFFEGLDSISNEMEIKQRISFVYDENYFYDDLTVQEMKNIIARFYTNWDEAVFQKYLKRFELPPRKKIKDLSKGMKMKFSIAMALSHHAELILMDEPTSGLDPVFRAEILEILSDLMQDENMGVLFSTHITKDLEKIADYITFINKGEVVFSDTKDAVMESYGIVKGGRELMDADVRKEFIGIRENEFGFEALIRDVKKVKRVLESNVVFERPTLDDIMLYTVRGNNDV
ncbi:ABC transporter ATP-binding protein [Thermoanaerobacteraceae bacterium SP2]|nr:ABC transporter ATP-binding protein [Thermoanaerobacteraceae bacterium SP2]